MARLAIFIDGAYLDNTAKPFSINRLDYGKIAEEVRSIVDKSTREPVDLLRTLYYTCPPYRGTPPTEDEERRYSGYSRFRGALSYLPRFQLREGRLARRGYKSDNTPILVQKRVDLLLGLDIALYSGKQHVSHIALVAGDSDFIPAVEVAKAEGVSTWLFHGPGATTSQQGTYHRDLWSVSDERREITHSFLAQCTMDY